MRRTPVHRCAIDVDCIAALTVRQSRLGECARLVEREFLAQSVQINSVALQCCECRAWCFHHDVCTSATGGVVLWRWTEWSGHWRLVGSGAGQRPVQRLHTDREKRSVEGSAFDDDCHPLSISHTAAVCVLVPSDHCSLIDPLETFKNAHSCTLWLRNALTGDQITALASVCVWLADDWPASRSWQSAREMSEGG